MIDNVISQLKPHAWLDMLFDGCSWDRDALFILDGVYHGFRVVDPGADIPIYDCRNYKSCFDHNNKHLMNEILNKELVAGKISLAQSKPSQVHSLGAVPKPNGSVRHITDCSMPNLESVNNYMKSTFSTFNFHTLDDVIRDVKPDSFMATVDLQDAYRSVPIHPEDRTHFGLRWNFGDGPIYLTDNFLCFGSKCSAFIFNRLTDAIARYMNLQGYCCYNYLDDFIVIGENYEMTCQAQLFLIKTLRDLGFYISWRKLTSPTPYCRFLGIDIDAQNQKLFLPDDKIDKLHNELAFWQHKKTATKKQMQRLCGVLNFCCKVVRGGRVYMFYMIQLLKVFNSRSRISLPLSFYEDISWWREFANIFNGQADFFDPVANTVELYSDACLSGLAAICQNDYYYAKVMSCDDDDLHYVVTSTHAYEIYVPYKHAANINVLELIAVLLALIRWDNLLINCRVLCYCDNLQVCYNLCKDKTRNALSNQCLRDIFWRCVSNNIYISPAYIPSCLNVDADYLSRLSLC